MAFEKATYEDLLDDHFNRLTRFLNMPVDELIKIKDCWAIGSKVDQLLDNNLHPDNGEYIFLLAPPRRVIHFTDLLDLPTKCIFNNDVSDFRFITTLERWEKDLPVDPAIIYLDGLAQKLKISDGRHRLVLSAFMNKNPIPIAVLISQVKRISDLLNIQ